uniref:Nascent polypeptide-associated complex subunit beta n=1 Tax=Arcella intermedia TaxID=1963864 RepID=A0A6B2LQL6_9EUKA|eukprot:TRINITY_DN26021_c0_g1_i1.p1 TRINITY_DN26021_c0_g1~~TRINITY_DN26021_c0_g1_i1.p1  ORF type:complete len:129 (+),score=33.60 TRINITY_DN26021_c0_g1_i1:58-444(+)
MNQDKLKRLEGQVRTGGKGTVRRKVKKQRKVTTTDDKKLQSTLKKIGVNPIPAIEEVSFFNKDGTVRIFKNPKLQAALPSNTFVVSGNSEVKSWADILQSVPVPSGTEEVPDLASGVNFEEVATKTEN